METLRLSNVVSVRKITYENDIDNNEVKYFLSTRDRVVYVLADKGVIILILPDSFDVASTLLIKRLPESKYPVIIRTNNVNMEGGNENALDDEDNYIVFRFFENTWYIF